MSQETQSQLITQFVSSFTMDEINTSILFNSINTTLHEKPTTLSKQVIKAHYIKYLIAKCDNGSSMNEINTQIGIDACTQMFGEPFGNEPAKTMLKAAYINYFIEKCAKIGVMNEINTQIGITACMQMFGEPFGNEPARDRLAYSYVEWFKREHGADYELNTINYQILQDRHLNLFNSTLESSQPITTHPGYGSYFNSSDHASNSSDFPSNPDLASRPLVVAAGDGFDHWIYANHAEGDNKHTQEMVKGCINALTYTSSIIAIGEATFLGGIGGSRIGGIGVVGGAIVGGAGTAGGICWGGLVDRVYENFTSYNDNIINSNDNRACDQTNFACNSSGQCFDAKGVCKADTSFVDSLGKDSHGGNYP